MAAPDACLTGEEISSLAEALGYGFRDPGLLMVALTHSSAKSAERPSNERLEFLGDAVLSLVIADHLYVTQADSSEGKLSVLRAQVVRDSALASAFDELGLTPHLRIQPDLCPAGGAAPASILEDALEAVVGAVYLDGGLVAARELVLGLLGDRIERALLGRSSRNFKAQLQQLTQARFGLLPRYRVKSASGPDHRKRFEVVVLLGGQEYATGKGWSKKTGEQRAAQATLQLIESGNADDLPPRCDLPAPAGVAEQPATGEPAVPAPAAM